MSFTIVTKVPPPVTLTSVKKTTAAHKHAAKNPPANASSRPLKNSFPRETAFVSRWHYAPKFQSFLENMAFSAAC
jgi:hypothetical protein